MRLAWIVIRTVMAIAVAAATIVTYQGSAAFWAREGFEDLVTVNVNFFSFFTVLSNIASIAVFAIGAIVLARGATTDPRWFGILRACVVTAMVVTGIVYNLLLRGLNVTGGGADAPWTNEVMHVVAPIVILLDWLFAPGRPRLGWKHIGTILIFPLTWVGYTLIRGPLVWDQVFEKPYWYPYPFLNPNLQANGYWGVLMWVVIISLTFVVIAAGVVWISRHHERWPLRAAATRKV